MKKQLMALGLLGVVGVGAVSAIGPEKDLFRDNEDIQQALDNGDYDAFIEAVSAVDENAADRITEEVFERILERHDIKTEIEEAIEDDDYDAWIEAVSKLPHGADIAEVVTEDEWDELKELHEARQNGDRETAKALAEEIGLPEKKHGGHGKGPGLSEEVQDAIENGDYDDFVAAVEAEGRGGKIHEYVTEENYDTLVALHEAIQSRDKETAAELREELGLPEKPQRGDGDGERQGRGSGQGNGQRFSPRGL